MSKRPAENPPPHTVSCASCGETVELTGPTGSAPVGWKRLVDMSRWPGDVYSFRCAVCEKARKGRA